MEWQVFVVAWPNTSMIAGFVGNVTTLVKHVLVLQTPIALPVMLHIIAICCWLQLELVLVQPVSPVYLHLKIVHLATINVSLVMTWPVAPLATLQLIETMMHNVLVLLASMIMVPRFVSLVITRVRLVLILQVVQIVILPLHIDNMMLSPDCVNVL